MPFFKKNRDATQTLNIPPNLMSGHSSVNCGKQVWGVMGEEDGVGRFIGRCSVAKMMLKMPNVEGRKVDFLQLISHSEEVLIGANEPHLLGNRSLRMGS